MRLIFFKVYLVGIPKAGEEKKNRTGKNLKKKKKRQLKK